MKVYISNILPKELSKKDIQTIIEKIIKKSLYIETKEIIELFSKENGYYKIDNREIYKIIPVFKQNFEQIKNFENTNLDLLFDLTEYKYIKVLSHCPHEYIYTKILEKTYKLINTSTISLKIFYIHSDKDNTIVPIDYYIEIDTTKNNYIKDFLDNLFLKEDFNMLLSGLKEYL